MSEARPEQSSLRQRVITTTAVIVAALSIIGAAHQDSEPKSARITPCDNILGDFFHNSSGKRINPPYASFEKAADIEAITLRRRAQAYGGSILYNATSFDSQLVATDSGLEVILFHIPNDPNSHLNIEFEKGRPEISLGELVCKSGRATVETEYEGTLVSADIETRGHTD